MLSGILATVPAWVWSIPHAGAADGSWAVNANGNWTVASNWVGGAVAGGAGSTATFDLDITADRTITTDANITVGNLVFRDTPLAGSAYIIGGTANTITLDDGANKPTISVYPRTSDQIVVRMSLLDGAVLDVSALPSPFTTAAGGTLRVGRAGGVTPDVVGALTIGAGSNVEIGASARNSGTALESTATISGNTVFSGGGSIFFDLGATPAEPQDFFDVTGDLTLNGVTNVHVTPTSGGLSSGNYMLMTYTGNLTGDASKLALAGLPAGTRQTFALSTTLVPQQVFLMVTGMAGDLVWAGDGVNNVWDLNNTAGFSNGGSPDVFKSLDSVLFNDAGSAAPSVAITGTLQAGLIKINANAKNHTWAGPGKLSGSTALLLDPANTSKLTISGSDHDFVGAVDINGGALSVASINDSGVAGSLGAGGAIGLVAVMRDSSALGSGDITVQSNGTAARITRLELQGVTLANDIILSSTAQTNFRGALNASGGSTTLTDPVVRSIVNGGVLITAGVGNGGHLAAEPNTTAVLQLNGPIKIPDGSSLAPNIRVGTVELGDTSGAGNLTILQQGEGTVRLVVDNGMQTGIEFRMAISNPGVFDLNGNEQSLGQLKRWANFAATVTNSSAAASTLTIQSTADHTFSGVIEDGSGGGTVSLVKSGPHALTLSGANTYTGATGVNAGTLHVNGSTALGSSVTVSGILGGTGTVGGATTVLPGGRISPGVAAVTDGGSAVDASDFVRLKVSEEL